MQTSVGLGHGLCLLKELSFQVEVGVRPLCVFITSHLPYLGRHEPNCAELWASAITAENTISQIRTCDC